MRVVTLNEGISKGIRRKRTAKTEEPFSEGGIKSSSQILNAE